MERGAYGGDPGTGAVPGEPGDRDPGGYEAGDQAGANRPDPIADLLAGFDVPATPGTSQPVGSSTDTSAAADGTSPDAAESDSLGALAAATTEAPDARSAAVAAAAVQPDERGDADWQSVAEQRIDVLVELVRSAKGRAMSSGQCIVNRGDVLERLADIRSLLPTELGAAAAVLREKNRILTTARTDAHAEVSAAQARADALVGEATERADALMRDGLAEQERLVSAAAVTAVAARQAEFMVNDATRRAERRQQETDEYVDARLAAFEALLQKTLTQVLRGRERMHDEMAAYRSSDSGDALPADDRGGWDVGDSRAADGPARPTGL